MIPCFSGRELLNELPTGSSFPPSVVVCVLLVMMKLFDTFVPAEFQEGQQAVDCMVKTIAVVVVVNVRLPKPEN